MAYTYPEFASVRSIRQEAGKRYRMDIEIGPEGDDTFVVIQKNPSRANAEVSDHTINRVLNYLYHNREKYACLQGIGKVVFLNLIPWYETYSDRLVKRDKVLSDSKNLRVIEACLSTGSPCIIAWGNPPRGLGKPYTALSEKVCNLLRKFSNPVYHVGSMTRLGYPRHGQIWGYHDPLRDIKKM
ncbi:MAG: DUF1643 domain-containing protein [Robiginitalea sp.]